MNQVKIPGQEIKMGPIAECVTDAVHECLDHRWASELSNPHDPDFWGHVATANYSAAAIKGKTADYKKMLRRMRKTMQVQPTSRTAVA